MSISCEGARFFPFDVTPEGDAPYCMRMLFNDATIPSKGFCNSCVVMYNARDPGDRALRKLHIVVR